MQLSTTVSLVHKGVLTPPQQVEQILKQQPPKAYRRYHWRTRSPGKLSARFAFLRVQVPKDPIGETLWLILEWRDDDKEPCRAHLSSLPPSTSRPQLVFWLKERYRTEQMYREVKQELGLDQYEGRKWRGLMHHVTVVFCCYAFLVAERELVFPPQGPTAGGNRGPGRPNLHRLVRTPERSQRHVPHSIPTMRHLIGRTARRWLLQPPACQVPRSPPRHRELGAPWPEPSSVAA